MDVARWTRRAITHTIASVEVETGSEFRFVARGAGPCLAGPPIRIGHEALDHTVVLRSNRPDAARALFTSSAVASAIAALDARTRNWDWTFYPARPAGAAEMRIDCPGALDDAESLRRVQALLQAALERAGRYVEPYLAFIRRRDPDTSVGFHPGPTPNLRTARS